ncbi:lactonase family protein [Aureibaculum sp. A20]|uniref:Lactonase family protein n=1 Tax=Aureibaculum flavum TaxID=2795986 RepID=A0ABS0WTY1_9FLAO|nr:lactonase family protein [Aureibaculum flavum]MBJ2175308.1 lactonase family protein [Aureibaculum flavum]
MKYLSLMLIITTIISCKNDSQKDTKPSTENEKKISFFVGTYTDSLSEGIYSYSLSNSGNIKKIKLAAKTVNPSFLTKSADGKYLLAVNEINSVDSMGTLESYKITGDSLAFMSRQSSGGAHPCFVGVNKNGYVLTANYSSGNLGLFKLNKEGNLSDLLDKKQHYTNHHVERGQWEPHAHSAYFMNDSLIVSADLGTNDLWFYTLDTVENKLKGTIKETLRIGVDPKPGPRHIAFQPQKDWMYVINELNSTISLIKKDKDEKYMVQSSVSTLPEGYTEKSFCADIHISNDGKFLYASNRGHNSIAIFEINQEYGELTAIGYESVKGDWPRNFTLSPNNDFLLVANQRSENIVSFKRDKVTGLLTFVEEINVPSPVCILF